MSKTFFLGGEKFCRGGFAHSAPPPLVTGPMMRQVPNKERARLKIEDGK